MPIFSTSSLTDMPLVRLRELIMSSRWVRPISEIKRWFIRLKWLEWNESAGLYTPRSLIRKPKIYTTIECKRITRQQPYQEQRYEGATGAATLRALIRSPPWSLSFSAFPSPSRLPRPLYSRRAPGNDYELRVK